MTLPHRRNWNSPAVQKLVQTTLLQTDVSLADVVSRCRSRLCYLATPYTKLAVHPDGSFCSARSIEASVRAARWLNLLAMDGVTAVSPIVQAVEMVNADRLRETLDPLDAAFWEDWCRPLLRASSVVVVPPIPGWDESDGIWGEVRQALDWQMQVLLIAPGQDQDNSIFLGG